MVLRDFLAYLKEGVLYLKNSKLRNLRPESATVPSGNKKEQIQELFQEAEWPWKKTTKAG